VVACGISPFPSLQQALVFSAFNDPLDHLSRWLNPRILANQR
jgi:hypothetical protein